MTTKKRSKLTNLKFKEVSVCKQGMNEGAVILITKAEDASMDNPVVKFTKALGAALKAAATGKDPEGNVFKSDEEQGAHIEAQMGEVAKALESELPEPKEPVAKMHPKFEDDDDDDEDMEKSFIAKAVEEANDRVAKAESVAADALEQVNLMKAKQDRAELRKSVESMVGSIPAHIDELTDVMVKLDKADREKFSRVLKSADASARAGLLVTIGKGVPAAESAEGQLDALAKARAKEQKVSFAKAYTDVCDENQDLYAAAQRDHGLSR